VSALAVAPSPLDRVDGEPTLDDLLAGVWRELADGRTVACPVCCSAMEPTRSTTTGALAGRCTGCGSALA
jgi:hypothetical protein